MSHDSNDSKSLNLFKVTMLLVLLTVVVVAVPPTLDGVTFLPLFTPGRPVSKTKTSIFFSTVQNVTLRDWATVRLLLLLGHELIDSLGHGVALPNGQNG